MNDTLLSVIAQSKDRAWLIRCREYNLGEGRKDVAVAVDQRLRELEFDASIKTRGHAKTVEDRVKESLRVYRALLKLKHGRNQAAGYSEREISHYGHREALIRTIRRGKATDGLKLLAAHDRLDCAPTSRSRSIMLMRCRRMSSKRPGSCWTTSATAGTEAIVNTGIRSEWC